MMKKFVPMCIWRVATKLEMLGDEVLSDALKEAYATLVATDKNGHALCGCGGEARMLHRVGGMECTVDCSKCYVETGDYDSEDDAWSAWDTAMGLEKL